MEEQEAEGRSLSTRTATGDDIEGIVRCHVDAFPDYASTKLGNAFLRGMYSSYVNNPEGIAVVVEDSKGRVCGFSVGGPNCVLNDFRRWAWLTYAHLMIWRAMTNRFLRRRIIASLGTALRRLPRRLLRRRPKSASPCSPGARSPSAPKGMRCLLISIAVLVEYRGSGAADLVIESFRDVAEQRGFSRLALCVFRDNARAISFYRRHGFTDEDPAAVNGKTVTLATELQGEGESS